MITFPRETERSTHILCVYLIYILHGHVCKMSNIRYLQVQIVINLFIFNLTVILYEDS